jgi:malic enzyme
MKRCGWLILTLILTVGLAGCGDSGSNKLATEKYMKDNGIYSMDYKSFNDDSYKTMTDIQKKEYLKNLNNPIVEWSGYVYNATSSEVYIGVSGTSSRSFDAEIVKEQINLLPDLKKDQAITIRGKLIRPGIVTGWVIREAKIISK